MITLLRSIAVAFTTYSRIPMPVFEWKDEDMKYSMCAFPLTGVVLSALSFCVYHLLISLRAGNLLLSVVMTVLPLLYTGGIHMDGFMDTTDALCSYGDRAKKLDILKDPHIGAFAVIHALIYVLFSLALWNELIRLNVEGYAENMLFYLVMTGYIMSRILSALAVVSFKKAKDEGMVSDISKAQDRKCRGILIGITTVFTALLVACTGMYSLCVIAPSVFTFLYYRRTSYRSFGGITGDLAGWFLQICELSILFTAVAVALVIGRG